MDVNKIYYIDKEKFAAFQKTINEILIASSKLNFIELKNDIEDFTELGELEFFFFMNYQKMLTMNIDFTFLANKNILKELDKIKIDKDITKYDLNFYKVILHMQIYLLSEIEKNQLKEINKSNYIIIQNFIIISKLYKVKVYTLKKIILYLNTLIIFINKIENNNDKKRKIKSIIFLELLIEKYFCYFLTQILNNNENKKEDIKLFFKYMINVLNSNEFKEGFNQQILAKNKIIEKLINIILNNITHNENFVIYNEFKDDLIKCFANIYKNNSNNFVFFDELIKQNKNSFINLFNYEIRKDCINKDIYTHNFYIELLNKIFMSENGRINNIKNEENYFLFNGNNSKMTFNLNGFSLNNSIIIFLFQLSKDVKNQTSDVFPLLNFQSLSEKELQFKLYIKKEDEMFKLYLHQETRGNQSKIVILNKIGNIQLDVNYIISIHSLKKKIKTNMIILNGKNELFTEEFDQFDLDNNLQILKIGYCDNKNWYFKGYIGTFIIMKNIRIKKNCNIDNIINDILALKYFYRYFPLFLSESSIYNLEEVTDDFSEQDERHFNDIKNILCKSIEKCDFDFYLAPEMLGINHSINYNDENKGSFYLTQVPNITLSQKYIIMNMDISLVKLSKIHFEFVRNNGFDYFILLSEYYYNFFTLIELEQKDFAFYSKNPYLENILTKSLRSILLILNKYYTNYKYILHNIKKLKTLFRNFHELLKCKIKGLLSLILNELYGFYLGLKNELGIIKGKIYKNPEDNNLFEGEKVLSNFSEGLLDILLDFTLYLSYQDNDNLNSIFQLIKKIIKEYTLSYDIEKEFPFEKDFFYKFFNFFKVLETIFVNDYYNKNVITISFFDLIKEFFLVFENKETNQNYFRQLFRFVLKNYANNLNLIIHFLNFIHEMLYENFDLEVEDIEFLLQIFPNNNRHEDIVNEIKNQMLIEKVNLVIFNILLIISLVKNSKEIAAFRNIKLEALIISDNNISNIIEELTRCFEYFLKNENHLDNIKKSNLSYMKIFGNIFSVILDLFKKIIRTNEKLELGENNEKTNDKEENEHISNLMNLLSNIKNILETDFKTGRNKSNYLYCIINFLIFYYRIIFCENNILLNSEKPFIDNLLEVIDLCELYYLNNCLQLFKFKILSCEYQKTIIGMIYDLSIQLFLYDKSTDDCYEKLLEKYNFIFYDRQFIDNNKKSIFYVNDYLNFLLNKKKEIKKDDALKVKCKIIYNYNNKLLVNEEKFIGNMVTYFLYMIVESKKQINDNGKNKNSSCSKLTPFLEDLFLLLLNEHKDLFKLDKKYFYPNNSSILNLELAIYIKEKFVNKNISGIEEIKKNIMLLSEKYNVNDKSKSLNKIQKKIVDFELNNEQIQLKNNISSLLLDNLQINNKIHFFYELDKYYITNIKKEIMNCIFSLYYLDELFYSKDFCIIKKYYTFNYLNKLQNIDSKKLNFPSTIKNYRNNFEPPLFVKKFNSFTTHPYFPITHSYIKDEILNNILSFDKSISLFQKDFFIYENTNEIECELIKSDIAFYGKLYYKNSLNYLLFQEQEINFLEEEGFKHIFLISKHSGNKKEENKNHPKKKVYKKKILMLLEDIEEIIEMRILLLWKGIEIYLKNGKSYIFNFLTTLDYDNFKNNLEKNNKLKYLLRKKNFLSDKNIITKNWTKSLLSNFNYLLYLNRYSSRSYNDPGQYPIFPWLLYKYKHFFSYNIKKYERDYIYLINKYETIKEESNNELQDKIKTSDLDIELLNIIKSLFPDELIIEEIKQTKEQNNNNNQNNKMNMKKSSSEKDNKINKYKVFFIKNKEIKDGKNELDYTNYFNLIKRARNKIENCFRQFNYPPSVQNEENRFTSKNKYENDEDNGEKFPIHFGTHYSNVGYIYYYLMRQQPYDNLLVKMQGDKLETCNRMFMNVTKLQETTTMGFDNRELIPEFFTKIEFFLNLNCDFYRYLEINHNIADDCIMGSKVINKEYNYEKSKEMVYLSDFVNFILQHKRILNNKIIGNLLVKWIDNIFGVNQLPKDKIKESCNIFEKASYEKKINLEEKIKRQKERQKLDNKLTNDKIKTKLKIKIAHIINFGVVPSQLFNEIHPDLKMIINKDKDQEQESNINKNENNDKDELLDIIKYATTKLEFSLKGDPIYFKINPTINKIIIYNREDNLMILDCELFNEINYNSLLVVKHNLIEKSNILCSKEALIYQIKYGFCSFDHKLNYFDDMSDYHTYHYQQINYLLNIEKIKKNYKKIKNEIESIKIITCRHLDFSFKIHYLGKAGKKEIKNKKNENQNKIYSFICEDFVTVCCCLSSNAFIVGLNNGKLIYYILNEKEILNSIDKKKKEIKREIKIQKKMYIQGHKGKINTIEIDKRLGIVITSGDDNYIFMRKLYDFELLLPINIKSKFKILLVKISSSNFLYVLCLNKKNNKKIIFGYTLSGIKFSKSAYGFYDNINFTEDGNIITMNNKSDFTILSGNQLKKLTIDFNEETKNKLKEINNTNWLQYDYFMRGLDQELNEIITFFENKEGKNQFRVIKKVNLYDNIII